ncbi:MAG: endonuclease [Bacteroidota bacterium]
MKINKHFKHWAAYTHFAIFYLFFSQVFAQIPPGYYDPATGQTGVALQTALYNIIKGHTIISYSAIPGYYPVTDAKPDNVVWDMYSDIPGGTPPYIYHYNAGQACGNYSSEGDCYNREHSWPKSWFNDTPPMNSDIFHIYPTDGYVNGKRSNYPYGTVSTAGWTSQNGSKVGACSWPGYSGTIFEPLDEYKGDFARTYFYMSTRYFTEDGSWNITEMTNKSQLKPWALQMMLHWSNADPVSIKETDRNNAVYLIQHNRNPFIDHPEYAALIWGDPVTTADLNLRFYQLLPYPNPATERVNLDLPESFNAVNLQLTIISVGGIKINPNYTQIGNTLLLDVRSLSKGIYFLILNGKSANYHAKLLKE